MQAPRNIYLFRGGIRGHGDRQGSLRGVSHKGKDIEFSQTLPKPREDEWSLIPSQSDSESFFPEAPGAKRFPEGAVMEVGLYAVVSLVVERGIPVGFGEVGFCTQVGIDVGRRG